MLKLENLRFHRRLEKLRVGFVDAGDETARRLCRELLDAFDEAVAGRWTRGELEAWCAALTRREKDVLNLLLRRMSNDQISDELGIKRRAVENYISSIYEKIGINDRAELLLRCGNMI